MRAPLPVAISTKPSETDLFLDAVRPDLPEPAVRLRRTAGRPQPLIAEDAQTGF
jgi:hypothetical protein